MIKYYEVIDAHYFLLFADADRPRTHFSTLLADADHPRIQYLRTRNSADSEFEDPHTTDALLRKDNEDIRKLIYQDLRNGSVSYTHLTLPTNREV